jgi:hypothetical protein
LQGDAAGNSWTIGTYPHMFGYYGGKLGGAPIVWVAIDKHANYPSEVACNSGGGWNGFGNDNCMGNNSFTFMSLSDGVVGPRNLGSAAAQRMNCVASNNPAEQVNNHPECFWNNVRFTGWSGAAPDAAPYLTRLSGWRY